MPDTKSAYACPGVRAVKKRVGAAMRSGVLLAAIVREGVTIIPGGLTTIEEGDHVLVIAQSMGLNDLTDILA